MNTNPITALLGPVSDREYLVHIGVIQTTPLEPKLIPVSGDTGIGMPPPQEIKTALEANNTNMAALARHLGLSYSVVERAINGYGRNARVEAEVERLMGKKIFPPKKKPGTRKSTWPTAHSMAVTS